MNALKTNINILLKLYAMYYLHLYINVQVFYIWYIRYMGNKRRNKNCSDKVGQIKMKIRERIEWKERKKNHVYLCMVDIMNVESRKMFGQP